MIFKIYCENIIYMESIESILNNDWPEKRATKKEGPKTAFELLAQEFDGDMDLAERRLSDFRDKSRGDINNMTPSGRKSCRLYAIIFLTLYQGTKQGGKYFYSGISGQGVTPLLNFAKNVIANTPELEAEIPSRGLGELLADREAA